MDLSDDEVEVLHGIGPIVLSQEDAFVHSRQRLEQGIVLVQVQV
jgi:hypothetical protein